MIKFLQFMLLTSIHFQSSPGTMTAYRGNSHLQHAFFLEFVQFAMHKMQTPPLSGSSSYNKRKDVIPISPNYRNEWKHEITMADLPVLRRRLQAVAAADPHAPSGSYQIRSLYFDTPGDKALREKIDGVNQREKFRLRCYNFDFSLIKLEKKSKRNGLCQKEYAPISREQVQALLLGRYGWMKASDLPLVRELYLKMITQGLRPKTIVDYTRDPFVFPPGSVRVTLDYGIRTGLGSTDFLNPQSLPVPAGGAPAVLEVKWGEFLPDIIRDAVQLSGCRTGAFSKYAFCRIYG